MCRILPVIESLDQHLYHLAHHPESYRPQQCPRCGLCGVWRHGYYRRKVDREGRDGVYLDPVPIPRFYCRHCQSTGSRLPGCMAPRRWYPWIVQQTALALLLGGSSLRQAARMTQCFLRHKTKFKILFQPTYHPWVNKIELLWKQLHDTVTRNHRYSTMNKLMEAVRTFMQRVSPYRGNAVALVRV